MQSPGTVGLGEALFLFPGVSARIVVMASNRKPPPNQPKQHNKLFNLKGSSEAGQAPGLVDSVA